MTTALVLYKQDKIEAIEKARMEIDTFWIEYSLYKNGIKNYKIGQRVLVEYRGLISFDVGDIPCYIVGFNGEEGVLVYPENYKDVFPSMSPFVKSVFDVKNSRMPYDACLYGVFEGDKIVFVNERKEKSTGIMFGASVLVPKLFKIPTEVKKRLKYLYKIGLVKNVELNRAGIKKFLKS